MWRVPVITGVGLVTPLGASAQETWSALLEGRAIEGHARAALGPDASRARVDQLAIAAGWEAMEGARWLEVARATRCDQRHHGRVAHATETALVVGTSKGAITSWITPLPHMSQEACVVGGLNLMGVASTAWEVGKALGLSAGPRLTVSGACASGLGALVRAAMMIRAGEVDRALVVAAEASVHPLFIGCFKRLGVLPPEGGLCRPLDERREGFLVSESAAAVCLEAGSESDSAARPWAVVDRFALGGDATHLTGSDPEGATLRRLLKDVTAGRSIDLVHAHATGTTFNDPIEVAAYADVVGEGSPMVYSHKGALGHSLGASGLVSIVLNCMAHRSGIVPGNVRTERPIRLGGATPLRPIIHVMLSSTKRRIRRSIAVAAGFGGAMGVVALTT